MRGAARTALLLGVVAAGAAASGCALWDLIRPGGAPSPPASAPPARPAPPMPPNDADADGIADADDLCPGTAPKVAVDAGGCVVIGKVVLGGGAFRVGSALLTPAAHDVLRSVAATLKQNEGMRIEVAGHTDGMGEEGANQALSERRAEAVRAFLVKEGIDPEHIVARGYGESRPAATNDTAAGRAANRRVEFRLIQD